MVVYLFIVSVLILCTLLNGKNNYYQVFSALSSYVPSILENNIILPMSYFHTSALAIYSGPSHRGLCFIQVFKAHPSFNMQQSLKTSHINPVNTRESMFNLKWNTLRMIFRYYVHQ